MYMVDNVAFDGYEIESVNLNLRTCVLTLEVIYHRDNKRVTRTKQITFPTTCDVDINEYINKLKEIHAAGIS